MSSTPLLAAGLQQSPPLLGDLFDDLLSTVTGVGVPKASARVEVTLAGLVVDPDAIGAFDHELISGDLCHVCERVPEAMSHRPQLCCASGCKATGNPPNWRSRVRMTDDDALR